MDLSLKDISWLRCLVYLTMPGVNLDFLPASVAPEASGSPDSPCAESGLEEAIGQLLIQEDVEDAEEQFDEQKFELTLRCAVGEIHTDMQAFGKRVDARLEAAAAQVAPLAEILARLQEENLQLKIQQETIMRQVEVLCLAMGLPDPQLQKLSTEEIPHEAETLPNDASSCTPQETEALHRHSSSTEDADSPQDTAANSSLQRQSSISKDTLCFLESFCSETSEPQKSEPSPVPHPPTFASHRSLSAPSLMANISSENRTVLLPVNGPYHYPI